MALQHIGTKTSLKAQATSGLSDGDHAYMYFNERNRLMEFHKTGDYSDHAEDTTNHPYYVRPDDYAGAGVWREVPGTKWDFDADDVATYDVFKGEQIVIGAIQSPNWTTNAGSRYDLDNQYFKLGGSNVNADLDTVPGVFMGLDDGVYKLSVGKAYGDADEQSYIIWNGSALSMRMASGETFDLYGGLDVYGSVNVYQGGDITLSGGVAENPSLFKIEGATEFSSGTPQIQFNEDDDIYFGIYQTTHVIHGPNYRNTMYFGPSEDCVDDRYAYMLFGEYDGNFARYISISGLSARLMSTQDGAIIDAQVYAHYAGDYGVLMTPKVSIIDSGTYSFTSAILHLLHNTPDGGIPVVSMEQADVSEEFIRFIGSAASGVITQSIVNEGDQSSETREGWIKVYVQDDGNQITDQAYYIPIYSLS